MNLDMIGDYSFMSIVYLMQVYTLVSILAIMHSHAAV